MFYNKKYDGDKPGHGVENLGFLLFPTTSYFGGGFGDIHGDGIGYRGGVGSIRGDGCYSQYDGWLTPYGSGDGWG